MRSSVALVVAAVLVFAAGTAANASGTARVAQSDGVVHEYHVTLEVIDHRAVRITSEDRRGTLVVAKAACSYAGVAPGEYELDSSNLTLVSQ